MQLKGGVPGHQCDTVDGQPSSDTLVSVLGGILSGHWCLIGASDRCSVSTGEEIPERWRDTVDGQPSSDTSVSVLGGILSGR